MIEHNIIVELFSVTMMCSNIRPSDPTQNQSGDKDTYDDSSRLSGIIILSQNTAEMHAMISEISETTLVPLSQITKMIEVDNVNPDVPM